MANYNNSTINDRSVFPENAVDGQDWGRVEPLLTANQLEKRFLFAIPLVSPVMNPRTKKFDVKTDEDLKEHILRAVAKLETILGVDIFPVQRDERVPFDRAAVDTYMYMKTQHKPILSVDKLSVMPSNLGDAYILDPMWISKAYFTRGQINLTPMLTVGPTDSDYLFPASQPNNGGAFFLAQWRKSWVPAWWRVVYTSGFPEGRMPRVMNEIIGMTAAIDICNDIQAGFRFTSHSLGIDGVNQSQSGPGPQLYKMKIDELRAQLEPLIQKIKTQFGSKFVTGVA